MIVVSGAKGQLGRELCRILGDRAFGFDIDQVDITDKAGLGLLLERAQPEAIINCAAYTLVDQAEAEPQRCQAINAAAVDTLTRHCREYDCPLVQISTDYVFGGRSLGRPWRETDVPSPQGVYASTKREGELAAESWKRHVIVRTCGLYARPSHDARNFVGTMLRLGERGGSIRTIAVVDDQECTPSYVPHVARAVAFLTKQAIAGELSAGYYHVTNTGATTWYEFAQEIFRLAGVNQPLERISTEKYGAAAPRPSYSVLDTATYRRLGGPALPSWQEALSEYISERRTKP